MPVNRSCGRCGEEFSAVGSQLYCNPCRYLRSTPNNRVAHPITAAPAPKPLSDKELLEQAQERGYTVTKDRAVEPTYRLAPKSVTKHRIGVVSDMHLGSKCQQLTYLHEIYDIFEKEGIDTVLNAGDLVHGTHKMHRDMVYELHVHGADAQVDYAVKNYPRKDGIKTILIAGNHDTSHWEDSGIDVCRAFAQARPDVEYLGRRAATLQVGSANIYMWHPKGGGSYALSYRLQKMIEQFAPENKPHMVLMGHLHSSLHLVNYRNVEGFRLPCYQSQTPFEVTLGLNPVIGGLILDLETSKNGLEDITTRWIIRRIPIPNDY